jgi:hypothetical protein
MQRGLGLVASLLVGNPFSAEATPYNEQDPEFTKNRKSIAHIDKVILHTTEGSDKSAYHSVKNNGSCNYLVQSDGEVMKIVEEGQVAHHAGVSKWGDLIYLNDKSIGIEVAGYHDKDITQAQKKSLGELIGELKERYQLQDEDFMPHSQVAFGRPNKYWPKNHRGRKRCGWQFSDNDLRAELGLHSKPKYDPNVENGEFVVADKKLHERLYKDADQESIPEESTPDTTQYATSRPVQQHQAPHPVKEVAVQSNGNLKVLGRDGKTAWSIAKSRYDDADTLYVIGDDIIRGSELTPEIIESMPLDTPVLIGYEKNEITSDRSAFSIVGNRYDDEDVLYKLPNKPGIKGIVPGDKIIDFSDLDKKTAIIYKIKAA